MSTFLKDQMVFIPKLKREGRVLDVLPSGVYRVVVQDKVLEIKEKDLQAMPDKLPKYLKKALDVSKKASAFVPKEQAGKLRVDLHGLTVEQALPKVEAILHEALLQGIGRVEIIHGIGTGKLKTEVHRYLTKHSAVDHFQTDSNNIGTTWVYL